MIIKESKNDEARAMPGRRFRVLSDPTRQKLCPRAALEPRTFPIRPKRPDPVRSTPPNLPAWQLRQCGFTPQERGRLIYKVFNTTIFQSGDVWCVLASGKNLKSPRRYPAKWPERHLALPTVLCPEFSQPFYFKLRLAGTKIRTKPFRPPA